MKRKSTNLIWPGAFILMLACKFSVNVPNTPTPLIPSTVTSIAPTAGSAETLEPTRPASTLEPPTLPIQSATSAFTSGTDVSYFGMYFTIPSGLANRTQNDIIPQSNDPNLPFQVYPAYTRFILQGYPLQGKVFEPQVLIYPAKEFAHMSEDAKTIINNLQNILLAQRTSPAEPIPFLPMINAGQIIHTQEKFLTFKNGMGIRYITQYDQAPLPINNTEIFYTFQGLTSDGDYYVSVTMPINLPFLPADNTVPSTTPPDGVPFELDIAKYPEYLFAITDRLNHIDNPFNPALETLDTLVQSLLAVGQK